ncbi:MAG: sulfur transferase domain-containing protein [Pseudomonadota bacterium]
MRMLTVLVLFAAAAAAFADEHSAAVGKLDFAAIGPASGDVSAGQPSEEQLAEIAGQGYVAVIDLRGAEEDRGYDESAAAAELGLTYSALPIESADAINVENARRLGALLDGFDGPVLLHCGSGNRVGALVALLEKDRGASAEEALAAGRAAGLTRLEGLVEKRLEASEETETETE